MNPNFRNFALWVIIILLVVALVMLFQNPGQRVPSQDIAFSQLLNEVDQGHVREVTIAGNEITGHFTDNRAFATYAPNDPTLVQSLYKKNVSITAKPPGLAEATKIIIEKRQDLEILAKGLLEYETLTGEEIVELLKGHPPVRDTGSDEPPLRGSPVPTTAVTRPKPGPEPGGLEPQPQA